MQFLIHIIILCAQQVNVTLFENCQDHGKKEVELLSVEYACTPEGICDTVHGTYEIYVKHELSDYEVYNLGSIASDFDDTKSISYPHNLLYSYSCG